MKKAISILFLTLLCLPLTLSAKPPKKSKIPIEQQSISQLQSTIEAESSNIDARCRLVGLYLEAGDTTAAEKLLTDALKLSKSTCLLMHRAHIAYSQGKITEAVSFCTNAIVAGQRPADDEICFLIDSISDESVSLRLKIETSRNKGNRHAPLGLAQLYLHRLDSALALQYMKEAHQRGDTTLLSQINELQLIAQQPLDTNDSVIATIPFTRTIDKIELSCEINGLRVKAELDTTATHSSISTIESLFLMKNDYVRKDEVIDNRIIIARDIIIDSITLHDIRLYHNSQQETPIVFCPSDLQKNGRIRVNNKKKCIEILSQ